MKKMGDFIKSKFYLKTWFICLMFVGASVSAVYAIIGIILLVLQYRDNKKIQAKYEEMENKVNQLIKYDALLDVEQEAKRIINEAEDLLIDAKESKEAVLQEGETIKSNAKNEAAQIISEANKKAEEIAGNAYRALKESEELAKTVKALKNTIDGYGYEYIVPTYTVYDQLSEQYDFTEAGKSLKEARNNIKKMVKESLAAKSDYVETNRRDTAVNFIIDAFNGKVDTILTAAKTDNFGVLEQKINDAFQIVNSLGSAFRNTAITEEYLNARTQELKFVVLLNEYRRKEKEEQQAIREQMKEEEKARKEIEKALKEAEKEEEMLKKAMEKVQGQISEATEEQRLQYEKQLEELNAKLVEAEEKNQRAISMAQQTKSGNVYVISNIGSFGENVYKIGMTRRLVPEDRIRELSDASVPFEFDIHAMIYSEDAPALENKLHNLFNINRLNKINLRKEFFSVDIANIRKTIEEMDIHTTWTMTAKAAEYRESLVVESDRIAV